ncbi:MAG: S1 RNA-binding domain-containing protein, partial [Anaerorhabdus sp.]
PKIEKTTIERYGEVRNINIKIFEKIDLEDRTFVNRLDEINQIKNDEIKMEKFGIETSDRERASTEAERDVEDMKKAEFMENKIGLSFDGVISSITKFGFYVELPNTVEGLVHVQTLSDDYYHYDESTLQLIGERTGTIYRLGQEVRVKLIDANKEKHTIDFAIFKEKKKKKQAWI